MRRRAAVGCVLFVGGCGRLLGDYSVSSDADSGPSSGDSGPDAFMQVASIYGGGDCAVCLTAECSTVITQCADDDACLDAARCFASGGAGCLRRPGGSVLQDVTRCAGDGTVGDGGRWIAPCEDVCALGRSLHCTDEPRDPPCFDGQSDASQRFTFAAFIDSSTAETFEGVRVDVCGLFDADCGAGEPTARIHQGQVTVALPYRSVLSRCEFELQPYVVQVGDPGSTVPPGGRFVFPSPFVLPETVTLPLVFSSFRDSLGHLNGVVLDCHAGVSTGARGVIIETTPAIPISYGVGGEANLDSTDLRGTFYSTTLETTEGRYEVVAKDAESERELARAEVLLMSHFWNTLVMVPGVNRP